MAHLRRVGLPLDDIRTVVTEPAQAGSVLAAYLVRLEAGLADARREISIVHHLLENTETPMHHCTLPATAFVHALREVRYAVCDDPDQPRLHGVYLDSELGRVRVVATDRYRLATSAVETSEQTDLHLLLPTAAVDELLAGEVTGSVDVLVSDGTVTRDSDAAHCDVSLLSIGEREVHVGATDETDTVVVAVNREFLLQALQAGNQLTLGLDDPIAPLAIRNPDRAGTLSILMPVRLDQPA